MKIILRSLFFVFALTFSVSLVSCKQDTKEKVQEAGEAVVEEAQEAAEAAGQAVEEAGEAAERAWDAEGARNRLPCYRHCKMLDGQRLFWIRMPLWCGPARERNGRCARDQVLMVVHG